MQTEISMKNSAFTNVCPVFLSDDVKRTFDYYVNTLGFKFAEHFDKIDKFATVYRDRVEFVLIQKTKGAVESNTARYGNGYDAYIDTAEVSGVDVIYEEYLSKGVKMVSEPHMTDYGSYEFAFEDIDGRIIGIGLIANDNKYFEKSNYLDQ